jgi:hypothetical protein
MDSRSFVASLRVGKTNYTRPVANVPSENNGNWKEPHNETQEHFSREVGSACPV